MNGQNNQYQQMGMAQHQYNPMAQQAQMGGMPGMQGMPGMAQQQYNPMAQGQQGQQGYGQQQAKPQSTVVEVIRSNYTTIALFEVSGGYDPAQQYPKALCFVMGVPGVKDPSKQSGRSYMQAQKIVMKFSTQEIRSLGQSLINIATFKQAAGGFEKHSDPSKNSYTQNNGQQQNTKKLKAAFDQTRGNIVISMNFGQNNVMIPVPLQDAFGLGHDLINIGNFSDAKLAEYKLAHKIGKEEITGIDYDPAGAEGMDQNVMGQGVPGMVAGQQQPYAQPQGQYNPTNPTNQVNPGVNPQGTGVGQMQYPQPQGMPGAQPGMYQGMPGAQ